MLTGSGSYLDKEDDEKIKVGYPSELLKQIFGNEVPYGVLQRKQSCVSDFSPHQAEKRIKTVLKPFYIDDFTQACEWM